MIIKLFFSFTRCDGVCFTVPHRPDTQPTDGKNKDNINKKRPPMSYRSCCKKRRITYRQRTPSQLHFCSCLYTTVILPHERIHHFVATKVSINVEVHKTLNGFFIFHEKMHLTIVGSQHCCDTVNRPS